MKYVSDTWRTCPCRAFFAEESLPRELPPCVLKMFVLPQRAVCFTFPLPSAWECYLTPTPISGALWGVSTVTICSPACTPPSWSVPCELTSLRATEITLLCSSLTIFMLLFWTSVMIFIHMDGLWREWWRALNSRIQGMKSYLLICESSSRIVSFQVQLPRIWKLLVALSWVTAFPVDLQCSNARGGGDTVIQRYDLCMQHPIKLTSFLNQDMQESSDSWSAASGARAASCLSDPSCFLCLWIIQKPHALEVGRGAQWTLLCTWMLVPTEIKISTECCRWDWTARVNLFMASLEVPLENVGLLLEYCSASNFGQKASKRNKTS